MAAEPPHKRAVAFVDGQWLAAGRRPADIAEGPFGFLVRHAEDRRQRERLGLPREEEVLRQRTYPND
jgi:hypothetical protein